MTDDEKKKRTRDAVRRWRKRNPGKDKEYRDRNKEKKKAYYRENKEKFKERTKRWREENREKIAQRERERTYGITQEQYDLLLEEQAYCCAICVLPPRRRRLSVDHCHETGKIRGLLCATCNIALGMLKDSPIYCQRAVSYLKTEN